MTRADLQARRDATAAHLSDLDALLALPDSALAMMTVIGGQKAVPTDPRPRKQRTATPTPNGQLRDAVIKYVSEHPGCTSTEIRNAVGGLAGAAENTFHRRHIVRTGGDMRRGGGGYRYYIPGTEPKDGG